MTGVIVGGLGLVATAGLGVVVWRLRQLLVVVQVGGPSMAPALRDGDRLLARRRSPAKLARGDVVVIRHPARPDGDDRWLIKRVAALPGEPAPPPVRHWRGWPDGTTLPPGRLAVLGDNPRESFDSRQWGWFDVRDVRGVVIRRLGTPAGGDGR